MQPALQRASSEAIRQHLAHRERLKRIEARAYQPVLLNAPVTFPPIPVKLLKKPSAPKPKPPLPICPTTTQRIIYSVAYEFGISVDDLAGTVRSARFTIPRFVVAGLLGEVGMSNRAIGRRLGNRDQTTILHARRRFAELAASEAFRNRLDQIKVEAMR